MRTPARWSLPGALDSVRTGVPLAAATAMGREEYCARVLACFVESALVHAEDHRMLFVNYQDLPDAVYGPVLDHFGAPCSARDRAIMRARARFEATNPDVLFERSANATTGGAADAIRVGAARWLDVLHSRLEELSRRGQGSSEGAQNEIKVTLA
jgi:hypothetical protein